MTSWPELFSSLSRLAGELKKPRAVLAGTAAGVLIGFFSKGLAANLAPLGDIYLSFLKMCVIPIMITAVVSSFGRLLSSPETQGYLKRIAAVFLMGLILTGLAGTLTALAGKPGAGLSESARNTLGQVLMKAEEGSPAGIPESGGITKILNSMIPTNIFSALYEGNNLQILFFSIIFGLTVGIIPRENGDQILGLTHSVFKAFEKAISLAMYGMPFGLMGIMAGQVARMGVDILGAMVKFMVLFHIAAVLVIVISGIAVSRATRKSVFRTFRDLKEPLLIAFGTRNSFATMPSIFDALKDNFGVPAAGVNLVVPLSVVLCRYGAVLNFTVGAVFVAQIYGIPMGPEQLLVIAAASILAALAGAGSSGPSAVAMISIVLGPLGLPSETAVILMLAAFPVIDPIMTVLNVQMASAAAVLVAGPGSARVEPAAAGSSGL